MVLRNQKIQPTRPFPTIHPSIYLPSLSLNHVCRKKVGTTNTLPVCNSSVSLHAIDQKKKKEKKSLTTVTTLWNKPMKKVSIQSDAGAM